jgi:anti-sigma B factor antagonist
VDRQRNSPEPTSDYEVAMTRDTVPLQVHRDETDRAGSPARVVFRLVGVLDIGTAGVFRESVEPHLRPGAEVVVDLSELAFCDSTGLGAIVILHRLATARECGLLLRSPVRRVAAVLAMTGVDQVVTVVDPPTGDPTLGWRSAT